MSKFSRYAYLTMVKDTFNEANFYLGSKKDVYIHQILVVMNYTTFANIAANDKQGYQITKTNESALVKLSTNCIFKEVQVIGDTDIDASTLKTTYFREFKVPIKLQAAELLYVGVLMADAGFCEIKLLVSEKDVAH